MRAGSSEIDARRQSRRAVGRHSGAVTFGKFGGDLLVGNLSFFTSEINAFNPVTDAFEGSIDINQGPLNAPGGLWSLTFGGGDADGSKNTFTSQRHQQ